MTENEKIDINTEFYKKVNQQLVQKDNLIRLLQMKLKQYEETELSNDTNSDDSKTELEEKIQEQEELISRLELRIKELEEGNENGSLDINEDPEFIRLSEEIEKLKKTNQELNEKLSSKDMDSESAEVIKDLQDEINSLKEEKDRLSDTIKNISSGKDGEENEILLSKYEELVKKGVDPDEATKIVYGKLLD
jgi:FtsZ-binding cell division protein ZapB